MAATQSAGRGVGFFIALIVVVPVATWMGMFLPALLGGPILEPKQLAHKVQSIWADYGAVLFQGSPEGQLRKSTLGFAEPPAWHGDPSQPLVQAPSGEASGGNSSQLSLLAAEGELSVPLDDQKPKDGGANRHEPPFWWATGWGDAFQRALPGSPAQAHDSEKVVLASRESTDPSGTTSTAFHGEVSTDTALVFNSGTFGTASGEPQMAAGASVNKADGFGPANIPPEVRAGPLASGSNVEPGLLPFTSAPALHPITTGINKEKTTSAFSPEAALGDLPELQRGERSGSFTAHHPEIQRIEARLRELGAVYYILEAFRADDKRVYRFSAEIAQGSGAQIPRHFEAIDADPLAAMLTVLRDVEASTRDTLGKDRP